MNRISVTYTLKWEYIPKPNYQWTSCGKLFNIKTGKEIKKSYNSGSIGYYINGKFITLNKLKKHIRHIKKEICPF